MNQQADDIRCMLIPLHDGRLLLPNAAVVEIIGYRDPAPLSDTPLGVAGRVTWRQRDLPVIDFERFMGADEKPPSVRQRIAVCYAPDALGSWPLLGLLAQGIPRLLRLKRDAIETASSSSHGESAIKLRLQVGGEALVVPDLVFLQASVSKAASPRRENLPSAPGR